MMPRFPLPTFSALALACAVLFAVTPVLAQEKAPGIPPQADPVVLPVDSPGFVFSPGNWTGDAGRGGGLYRQTWCSGAYFRVTWTAAAAPQQATLLLDTSTSGSNLMITYNIDGVWKGDVRSADEIPIEGLAYPGGHTLTVYLQNSPQQNRWGDKEKSGLMVLRIKGVRLDAGSKAVPSKPAKKWLLEIGDSITEGCGTDGNLSSYSYLVGQALQTLGYEFCVSACGYSGWLTRGDRPPGDVPAYYFISGSENGRGGQYDDAASRWNKIDASHSLLDARGRLSAYGGPDEEPSIITINYGTNDRFQNVNLSDLQASINQGIGALRQAAPEARIYIMVPFQQFSGEVIRTAVAAYRSAHPEDSKVSLLDLGPTVGRGLGNDKGYWSGVHPNLRGHATFASQILSVLAPAASEAR